MTGRQTESRRRVCARQVTRSTGLSFGELASVTLPDGRCASYAYDALGHLSSATRDGPPA